MAIGPRLGEILIKEGLIKPAQLEKALEIHKKTGQRFGLVIVEQGFVKEDQITKLLEKHYQVPSINLTKWAFDPQIIKLITRDVCEKNCVMPVMKQGNTLVVAFADPSNIFTREDISFITRSKIQVVVASEASILSAIHRVFGDKMSQMTIQQKISDKGEDEFQVIGGSGTSDIISSLGDATDDAPIVKFVNMVLSEAIKRRASDIHIEPYEKKFRVRFRIDGILVETLEPPQGTMAVVTSRLKIMSKLDIAEKRKPQDGRMKVKTSRGLEIDFRVSTIPTLWGEKVVLRLLDKSAVQLEIDKLDIDPDDLKLFRSHIHSPQGMVLITGPTGSGKTTTIYAALSELNTTDVNLNTVEDPIEYNLEGINQVQLNTDAGLTFASAIKAFLRQDPDVLMVGEIRDFETAEIAFKAASTGHLVVSTLHTNDAPGTVIRLTEIGIAPYLITSCVNLIVSQRLLGRICENCKTPIDVKTQTLIALGIPANEIPEYKIMKGKGCNFCNGTGIKGRIPIFEMMPLTEKIREAILNGASQAQLRNLTNELGLKTLRRAALAKLKKGETTIEEVLGSSVKDF